MGQKVTLGGDRLGSGNKNKLYLHNYRRSTHNLSEKFTSTIGVGMLIPFLCKLGTRDDKFEIDLNAGLRTIPTKGPLFGSFKLQLDVFQVPLRLYQAILHNNPMAIGLKANQIKFPKMRLTGTADDNSKKNGIMAANNSLVKYLGISGIGTPKASIDSQNTIYRDMFGCGVLAYYDIFKNYYANKQEEEAYTLGQTYIETEKNAVRYKVNYFTHSYAGGITTEIDEDSDEEKTLLKVTYGQNADHASTFVITGSLAQKLDIEEIINNKIKVKWSKTDDSSPTEIYNTIGVLKEQGYITELRYDYPNLIIKVDGIIGASNDKWLKRVEINKALSKFEYSVELLPFTLSELDDLRMDILSFHQLGESYYLKDDYESLEAAIHNWQNPLGGICVKTYQSDIFNNWIQTEWIDGENGIAAITAISTASGSITIDALNFSEKLYNLLNRIAVKGGTYYDYLDAAYTESAKRFEETPMWIGGYSDEIVFEEIVQSAPAEGQPLGTLAGRGNLLGKQKGGKITVKCDEPCLIMGIASITPRIQYTQGNEFFNTEIDNLQDIHVPALDGIGFQNLLSERLHAASTILNDDGTYQERAIVGKVPAWIEYMTSVDKAYGDFAATDGDGYMILNRDYACKNGELLDATTYIDPAKYNYAFAYTKRDAQNFWLQIHSKITARRLMSAKQIPNV